MNGTERITCIDVAEAIGNLRWFIDYASRKQIITKDSSDRYKSYVNVLARQAAENPTASLMLSDL